MNSRRFLLKFQTQTHGNCEGHATFGLWTQARNSELAYGSTARIQRVKLQVLLTAAPRQLIHTIKPQTPARVCSRASMYTPGDSFHCLADRLFGDVWRCPSVWLKHSSLVATAFVMASAEEPTPKKRKGFVFKPIQIPDRTVKTPMFHQLRHGPAPPLPAPPIVQAMFGSERAFMAIDIETHALVPNNVGGSWWRTGEFGVLTTASEVAISTLRVVQVGWAIGEVTATEPKVKARLVLPEGFEIEASATAKHSITHAEAVSHGLL